MDTTRILEAYPRLEEHMRSSGYSDGYVRKLGECLRRMLPMMPGWECWDDASSWADGIPGDGARPYLRPYVVILRRFYERGALPRSSQSGRHMRENAYDLLCDGFRAVCDEYSSSEAASSKKPTTVRNEVLNAAAFLRKLESLGCEGPGDVTEEDVLRVLTDEDGLPVYSRSHVQRVRAVLEGAGQRRLLSLVPQPRAWRKVGDALDDEERARVVAALEDPGSGLSARDRAMGALMLFAGMRACDVASLRLASVDWNLDRITFEQQKTGSEVTLPLTAPVGNAIYDYVAGKRGASDSPYVFLSREWPYGRLKASSVYNAASRIYDAAGVRRGGGERRGTHLLRRTAASSMMAVGTSREVIASTLGHASRESTETYLVADVEALRACALDVSRFPVREGALDDEGV
ncbi:MAG: tyrosine-type recombinase/integrase [Atopobiaceae bacterium]|nr:tyrosine-type recombinase/integrase [Atopobiaceae bacterium]MBR3385602.1 tyrosine-type recombinase/integrase [Atopobiaceae bacterium]